MNNIWRHNLKKLATHKCVGRTWVPICVVALHTVFLSTHLRIRLRIILGQYMQICYIRDIFDGQYHSHPRYQKMKKITQTSERLHPSGGWLALLPSQLAPVADLHVVVGLHDVVDVLVGVDLEEKMRYKSRFLYTHYTYYCKVAFYMFQVCILSFIKLRHQFPLSTEVCTYVA